MNAAAFAQPPPPSRDALVAVAAEVTGSPATVRALWDAVRARVPQLTTRADIVDDFLVDALVEIAAIGLLEDFLFMLEARRLTSDAFMAAATALIGRPPLGSRLTVADDIGAPDHQEELLAMRLAGRAPPAVADMPTPDLLEARYQSFLPKDAREALVNKDLAMDRVCRIFIDGAARGCGVMVNDTIVATSAHVVEPLVEEVAKSEFAPVGDALKRLELRFPQPGGGGRDVASLAPEWLAWFSPPASCEKSKPFDVYDSRKIALPHGPWDVALIRLAEPPAHFRQGSARMNDDPPEFRFKVNILHYPPATTNRLMESEGEYLGRLSKSARLRLLHDAITIPGCSGSPCFNSDWEVVAIHQGGASDAAAKRKVNRAVPVAPWLPEIPPAEAPLVFQRTVPAIDGVAAQPVVGRRTHQRRIRAACRPDAPAADRLFIVRGARGRGKSFSIRLLQHLREQGHTLCVLDLEGMTGLDEVRFANLVLGVLGEAAGAKDQPGFSTRDREMLTVTLPDVVGRLNALTRDRPLWLAFDGFHAAGLIENAGIGQFVDGLIQELERQPQLRLMLTDWTRSVAPEYLGAISDLDQSNEWPTLNDFVDYVELRILPPGMNLPADARQELSDTLNQRIGPMLANAYEARPFFYAELLAAADLGSLIGS